MLVIYSKFVLFLMLRMKKVIKNVAKKLIKQGVFVCFWAYCLLNKWKEMYPCINFFLKFSAPYCDS